MGSICTELSVAAREVSLGDPNRACGPLTGSSTGSLCARRSRKSRQADGEETEGHKAAGRGGTFDGDRRYNPSRIKHCLLQQGEY